MTVWVRTDTSLMTRDGQKNGGGPGGNEILGASLLLWGCTHKSLIMKNGNTRQIGVFCAPMPGICERDDCGDTSETVFIVTGPIGQDGLGAYCDQHSAELEASPNHTPIGTVHEISA